MRNRQIYEEIERLADRWIKKEERRKTKEREKERSGIALGYRVVFLKD